MGITAAKLMDAGSATPDEASPREPAHSAVVVPDGFVPATKAQVAYWRQLCGAVSVRGKVGMPDSEWPPELAPTRFTLRALEERRLLVRRSRAWHVRRGWYTTLALLRLTAVPTPPLLPTERPGPALPTFAELERWELICRWLDTQPRMRARLPILSVPGVGAVTGEILRGMRQQHLVRHGEDCTWRLSPGWKGRLLDLWHAVTKAEGEREPASSDAPSPYSVAAGIDTWYLNRLDEDGLPTPLRIVLDDLQAHAKDEDDEVETPWTYDGVALMMYRAGVSTRQGGGVSWSYILRNPSLTLLIRKAPLGGIIAQARLGSECLWRLTPLAALNELDVLVRRLWKMGALGKLGCRGRRSAAASGRWQVSQVHLAHDVAHATLEVEQLNRYISRSRKRVIFESASKDVRALVTGLDDPLDSVFADDDDVFMMGGVDWDALYGDEDTFGMFDAFNDDGNYPPHRFNADEPEPVEERATNVHQWGRRVSGITWSPGAAVSFVAYDKVLEGRLRGRSHMPPIWKANGWDGVSPVTRHEARLRRDALRALSLSNTVHAHETNGYSETVESKAPATTSQASLDDPWVLLEHQQDIFAYVVGRPTTTDAASECPTTVDVAWLRRVMPDPNEANRSRWPTDPVWAVVQAPHFTEVPAEVRRLIRREVRSQQIAKRDQGAYGLVVSRTALASANPKQWELSSVMQAMYHVFAEESQKPGKDFAELVRHRRRALGLPVPSEGRVLPFRSQPEPVLPVSEVDWDDDADSDENERGGGDESDRSQDVHRRALLRTERRLEELDLALDAATHAVQTNPTPSYHRRVRELEQAYQHELQVHDAIRRQIGEDDAAG